MELDEEEQREWRCPTCATFRDEADGRCCDCGKPLGTGNPNFDEERWRELADR